MSLILFISFLNFQIGYVLFIICLNIFHILSIQHCISYSTLTPNLILNPTFSQNTCLNTNCLWNKLTYTNQVTDWLPEPQIQIGNYNLYTNQNLSQLNISTLNKIIQLAGHNNTCIKQSLSLIAGVYQLKITWAARKSILLGQSKIQAQINGQVIQNLTPKDYKIRLDLLQFTINLTYQMSVLKICGVGANFSSGIGPILFKVQIYRINCINCLNGYSPSSNSQCIPCNQSCTCDGWSLPLTNGICKTTCGDGFKKTLLEQCDDGNLLNHDGCNSLCHIQTCDQNCSCDGWYLPYNQNYKSCSSKCGDKIIRLNQQCDDGNLQKQDGCDSECKIEHPLLSQSQSNILSLIIFFFGFRITGMQMLNVFQHFQLVTQQKDKSIKKSYFRLSEYIHGYSNQQKNYLYLIPNYKNTLMKNFNFMFLLLLIVFLGVFVMEVIQWIICEIKRQQYQFIKDKNDLNNSKNMKKKNYYSLLKDNIKDNLQTTINSLQNKSDSKKNNIQSQMKSIQQKKLIQQTNVRNSSRIYNLKAENYLQNQNQNFTINIISLKRQILFNFYINSISIFTYHLTNQIKFMGIDNLLSYPINNFIILIMFGIFFIFIVYFIKNDNPNIGQIQKKFHNNKKWLIFWLIFVGEKIIFSILASFNQMFQIYLSMIIIKICIIIIFFIIITFYSNIQKIRSLMTQIIHLLILLIFFIDKYFIKKQTFQFSIELQLPQYFIQYLYISLLSLVFLLNLIFVIYQFKNKLRIHLRSNINLNINQQLKIKKIKNNSKKIIYQNKQKYILKTIQKNLQLKKQKFKDKIQFKYAQQQINSNIFKENNLRIIKNNKCNNLKEQLLKTQYNDQEQKAKIIKQKQKINLSNIRIELPIKKLRKNYIKRKRNIRKMGQNINEKHNNENNQINQLNNFDYNQNYNNMDCKKDDQNLNIIKNIQNIQNIKKQNDPAIYVSLYQNNHNFMSRIRKQDNKNYKINKIQHPKLILEMNQK